MPSNLVYLVSDNANTTLAAGISAASPSLQVSAGTGSLFPAVGAGQAFFATLIKNGNPNIYEVVQVGGRAGDNFTGLVRAQDGTTALSWNAGDTVALLPVAGWSANLLQFPQGQAQSYSYAADTGAANAYVVNLTPALLGHVIGMPIRWKAAHSSTGACTFNDGISTAALLTPEGGNLGSLDIVAGGTYETIWDGTRFQLTSFHRTNFLQLAGSIANSQVPQSAVTQWQAALAIAFSQLTAKPTTLAGYGITDGITAAAAAATYAALSRFANSLSTNGFQRFPDDSGGPGLIVQWGSCNPNGGFITVNLPTAFPNAAFGAVSNGSSQPVQSNVTSLTLSQITIKNTGGQSNYIAIGN